MFTFSGVFLLFLKEVFERFGCVMFSCFVCSCVAFLFVFMSFNIFLYFVFVSSFVLPVGVRSSAPSISPFSKAHTHSSQILIKDGLRDDTRGKREALLPS